MVDKLSLTVEHQRTQINDYVERVGSATIEHASLVLQIKSLEGKLLQIAQILKRKPFGV
jgi:hypothetical protein